MTRLWTRALATSVLAVILMLGAAVSAMAAPYGPPAFTWTVDDSGRASFDACASNGGVVGRIIEYKWVIFRATGGGSEDRIHEEVLPGHVSGVSQCDQFRYRFAESGRYRVVLDMQVDTGEREWVSHDLEVVLAQADLGVTVADSADPVVEGHPVTYAIVLTNHGPDAARDVSLTAVVSPPGNVDWDLSQAGGMGCGVGSGLSCTEGSIASGETREVRITARLADPGTIHVSTHVSSATDDPDADNDSAGESTTVIVDDQVPPVVTGVPGRDPDAHGWYARNVTIDWQATDPTPSSGTPSDPPDTVASTEGADVRFRSDESCDPAGNCVTGSVVLSIDKTAPELSCQRPAPVFSLGEAGASVSADVTDALAGPVEATVSRTVDTRRVGERSVDLTGTDRAGHETTVGCPFSVSYVFDGFFRPVDGGEQRNVAKAGRAIPLKWRLTDATGAPVAGLETATVTVRSLDCSLGTTGDLVEETLAGGSGLQDLGDGYYQLNWKTPKSYAGSCKTMRLDLGEGHLHTALFEFTR